MARIVTRWILLLILIGGAAALSLASMAGLTLTLFTAIETGATRVLWAALALPLLAGLVLAAACVLIVRSWPMTGWSR